MHVESIPEGYCLVLTDELRRFIQSSIHLNTVASLDSVADKPLAVVGDIVSRVAFESGLRPRLVILDCRSLRRSIGCLEPPRGYRVVRVWNPPGRVTWVAYRAVAEAWGSDTPTMIVVDGEEDLLAIPALLNAPSDAIVAYGVPGRGVAVVDCSWGSMVAEYIARNMVLARCEDPLN